MSHLFKYLALLIFIVPNELTAVMLDADNEGQVLIFPYVSTLGGNATLLTVTSQEISTPRALKLLFRTREGDVAHSLNLYLEGRGSWVASISNVDGQPMLNVPDNSCLVSDLPTLGSGSLRPISLDSGSLEILEMGAVADSVIASAVNEMRCEDILALWNDGGVWHTDPNFGLSPPIGRIRGTSVLINVNQGVMYSIAGVALSQFSDIAQHTPSGDSVPNLTSAHDTGTGNGGTTSIVCGGGHCREDTWSRPMDAVAAVLMAHELQGDYNIAPTIAAHTEVIINYPLRHFYDAEGNQDQGNPELLLEIRGREGESDGFGPRFGCAPLISSLCRGTWQLRDEGNSSPQSISVLHFGDAAGDAGEEKTSEILNEKYTAFFPDSEVNFLPESGAFWIGFETPIPAALTSNLDAKYLGVPVVAVVLERFTNGYLADQDGNKVLANYGNGFHLSRKASVFD